VKILTNNICTEVKKSGLKIEQIEQTPFIEIYNKYHDWDGGYESGHGYEGTRDEFYTDLSEEFKFLQEFITLANLQRCIIAPLHSYAYFEKWSDISENDIYQVLVKILNSYQIDKRTQCGIDLKPIENEKTIKSFIEGGFRYISRASLFFPEIGLVVQPWHHLNLLFFPANYETVKALIIQTICRYENLKMFEGDNRN